MMPGHASLTIYLITFHLGEGNKVGCGVFWNVYVECGNLEAKMSFIFGQIFWSGLRNIIWW